MCQACVDAMREIFPEVQDKLDFLLSCTSFPFGTAEQTREQLISLRGKMTTGDCRECYAIADEEEEAAMKAAGEQQGPIAGPISS